MSGKNANIDKIYTIALLAMVMLLACSGTAAAITENFHAYSTKNTVDVCACDFTEQNIVLQNTGDITSTYMIEQSGEAAKWATLAPNAFYLEPGYTKEMENFIKVPCSARGEQVLNTTIKTIFDLQKEIIQTVNVENCPNVQIIPKFNGVQQECPCTPVQYDFDIVNTGKHIETYKISVEPYSEGISLSTDFLVLEPGEKQTVTVFINLNCGEYGEKKFTLNALAQGTDILGQMDFDLNINQCYDYDLLIGKEYSVCQGVPNVIDYQINNLAEISNEYFPTVAGPEWIKPESVSHPAWGGETVNGELLLTPPLEDEGTYDFELKMLASRGEETKVAPVRLISEKCYDYDLYGEKLTGIQCKKRTDSLVIKNIGSRRTTYWLDLEGPEWVKLQKDMVVLDGGEEKEIFFDIDAPCETDIEEYANTLYVTIDEVNLTYSQEHNVKVMPLEDAFLPDVDVTPITTGYEGSEHQIEVTNTGAMWAKYDLGVEGPDWIGVNEEHLELPAGQTGYFTLSTYPTNETVADGYKAELVLAVNGEDIEYTTDLLVNVEKEKTWLDTMMNNIMWVVIGGSTLLLIVLILVIILVIRKVSKSPKQKKKDDKTAAKDEKKEDKKEEKKEKKAVMIASNEYARPKKEKKKTGKKRWPAVLALILIILILGAGAYVAYKFGTGKIELPELTEEGGSLQEGAAQQNTDKINTAEEPEPVAKVTEEPVTNPVPEENPNRKLTEEDFEESLIVLDRTEIPGKGNELEVTNQTELNMPMTIKNPTDRNVIFSVEQPEGSWIEFQREKLTVKPESEETINVKITPDLEALQRNDYTATMTAKLEGKKIDYEEVLEFTVKKPNNSLLILGLGLLGGLILLGLILAIISSVKRDKKPKEKKSKKEKKPKKVKAVAAKKTAKKSKPKKEKRKKRKNEETSLWPIVIIVVILGLIIGSLSFWAYNTFSKDTDGQDEQTQEMVEEPAAEEPAIQEPVKEVVEEPAVKPEPEPKLTEEDIQESLITIDRSAIPGEGNELEVSKGNYTVPMGITNPTDKTARFEVEKGNESWIEFGKEQILVDAEDIKNVNMTITPDYEKLKKNDYAVKVNTRLEGEKIDYEEQLDFKISEEKRGWPWWLYALAGLLVLGVLIGIAELFRRKKKGTESKKKKPVKKTSAKKTKKKTKPAKKASKKDFDDINKEIERIRKKTKLKIKKNKV